MHFQTGQGARRFVRKEKTSHNTTLRLKTGMLGAALCFAVAGTICFVNPATRARAATGKTLKPAAVKKLAQPQDTPGGQLRIVDDKGETAGFCPLERTEVRADVAGFVARVNVRQRFSNPSSKPVEAIYTFPL